MPRPQFVALEPVAWRLTFDSRGRVSGRTPVAPDAEPACRWCYGRPVPDLVTRGGNRVCSRVRCMTHVESLEAVEKFNWKGSS